jgi:hypothetical protein
VPDLGCPTGGGDAQRGSSSKSLYFVARRHPSRPPEYLQRSPGPSLVTWCGDTLYVRLKLSSGACAIKGRRNNVCGIPKVVTKEKPGHRTQPRLAGTAELSKDPGVSRLVLRGYRIGEKRPRNEKRPQSSSPPAPDNQGGLLAAPVHAGRTCVAWEDLYADGIEGKVRRRARTAEWTSGGGTGRDRSGSARRDAAG